MQFWKRVKSRRSRSPAASPRPSIEDPRVLKGLLARLVAGEAIYKILEDPKMPTRTAFYGELAKGTEIGKAIARAREAGQDAEIDETIRLADQANYLNFNAVRVKVMARQWRAMKLASNKFGDLAKLTIKSEDAGVLKVTLINDPDAD